MRFYPEWVQSVFLQCARMMSDTGDIYDGACLLTAYLFNEFHESVCLDRVSPEEISRETQFKIYLPYGKSPFPGVILFHGSSPAFSDSMLQRKRFFLDQGWAVMIANSITHARASDFCSSHQHEEDDQASSDEQCDSLPVTINCMQRYLDNISQGYTLTPGERALDFYEAVKVMRKHPDIDANRLSVVGYSHGGSVVLEALTLAANNLTPPGGQQLPDNPIRGINAASVYYPNCRPGMYFEHYRQMPDIPVQVILASQDEEVLPEICEEIVNEINQNDLKKKMHVHYFDGAHAFDMTEYPGYNSTFRHKVQTKTADFIRQHLDQCPKPEIIPPTFRQSLGF